MGWARKESGGNGADQESCSRVLSEASQINQSCVDWQNSTLDKEITTKGSNQCNAEGCLSRWSEENYLYYEE